MATFIIIVIAHIIQLLLTHLARALCAMSYTHRFPVWIDLFTEIEWIKEHRIERLTITRLPISSFHCIILCYIALNGWKNMTPLVQRIFAIQQSRLTAGGWQEGKKSMAFICQIIFDHFSSHWISRRHFAKQHDYRLAAIFPIESIQI